MSSGWRYGYDIVSMDKYIQCVSLYIPESFGVHGELDAEVTLTRCFMAKDLNGPHRPTHQVCRSKKISITFDLQGMRMMLSECQDCGV